MKNYPSISKDEVKDTVKDIAFFFKDMTVFILNAVKRFFFLFILLFIFIGGLGYFLNKDADYLYSSEMVCNYNYLHKKVYGEMIYRVNYLAETQSYQNLSEELGISFEDAKKVVQLKAKNIAGSPLHEDITQAQLPIYITAVVTDNNVFPILEKGIIYYFNNKIPYQQKRETLEKERLYDNIEFLDHSISQINRLIEVYIDHFNSIALKKDSTFSILGLSNLINKKEDLNQKKLSDQKMLSLQVAVEVLYGFAPTKYPNVYTETALYKIILLAAFLSWAIVILLHLIISEKQEP